MKEHYITLDLPESAPFIDILRAYKEKSSAYNAQLKPIGIQVVSQKPVLMKNNILQLYVQNDQATAYWVENNQIKFSKTTKKEALKKAFVIPKACKFLESPGAEPMVNLNCLLNIQKLYNFIHPQVQDAMQRLENVTHKFLNLSNKEPMVINLILSDIEKFYKLIYPQVIGATRLLENVRRAYAALTSKLIKNVLDGISEINKYSCSFKEVLSLEECEKFSGKCFEELANLEGKELRIALDILRDDYHWHTQQQSDTFRLKSIKNLLEGYECALANKKKEIQLLSQRNKILAAHKERLEQILKEKHEETSNEPNVVITHCMRQIEQLSRLFQYTDSNTHSEVDTLEQFYRSSLDRLREKTKVPCQQLGPDHQNVILITAIYVTQHSIISSAADKQREMLNCIKKVNAVCMPSQFDTFKQLEANYQKSLKDLSSVLEGSPSFLKDKFVISKKFDVILPSKIEDENFKSNQVLYDRLRLAVSEKQKELDSIQKKHIATIFSGYKQQFNIIETALNRLFTFISYQIEQLSTIEQMNQLVKKFQNRIKQIEASGDKLINAFNIDKTSKTPLLDDCSERYYNLLNKTSSVIKVSIQKQQARIEETIPWMQGRDKLKNIAEVFSKRNKALYEIVTIWCDTLDNEINQHRLGSTFRDSFQKNCRSILKAAIDAYCLEKKEHKSLVLFSIFSKEAPLVNDQAENDKDTIRSLLLELMQKDEWEIIGKRSFGM